jgi:hypothetical protein
MSFLDNEAAAIGIDLDDGIESNTATQANGEAQRQKCTWNSTHEDVSPFREGLTSDSYPC